MSENMPRSAMPKTTIALAAVLIALGVVSFFVSNMASWTALIPAILGVIMLICGIIALGNTRLGIHLALGVALLGIAGTFMNTLKIVSLISGDAERPLAVLTSTITFVLLLIYLLAGVRSFIGARRWRTSEKPTPSDTDTRETRVAS